MSDFRIFGTEISGNRGQKRELSSDARVAIVTAKKLGKSKNEIAKAFGCSPSTVLRTLQRYHQHQTFKSLPRKGRPQKLTRSEKRYIISMVKRFPRISYKALIRDANTGVSKSTIRRVLRNHYRRKWIAMKRIPLTQESARARLSFVRYWRSRAQELVEVWLLEVGDLVSLADLHQSHFSDESSIQNTPNNPNAYVFRLPAFKYAPHLVNLKPHVKADISIMVWGMVWKGGRSPLVIMERDIEAARNGYSANSYIWALEEGLLSTYRPGYPFQQDNASIHTARKVKDWFEEHGIWVIDWPPHSPDLNPIEHIWKALKDQLYRNNPYLDFLRGSEADIQVFAKALQDTWDSLPQALIDRLVDSMPSRLQAVHQARGWYTKY